MATPSTASRIRAARNWTSSQRVSCSHSLSAVLLRNAHKSAEHDSLDTMRAESELRTLKSCIDGFDRSVKTPSGIRSELERIHHRYCQFRLYEALVRYSGINAKSTVLDAGCGNGVLTHWAAIRAGKAVGVDVSIDSLKEAHRRYSTDENATFVLSDLANPCFKHGGFTVLLCCETIEHITNPALVLNNLADLIPRGGRLSLSTPNPLFVFFHVSTAAWLLTRPKSVLRKLRREENWWHHGWGLDRWILPWHLDRLMESAGFKVKSTRFVIFLVDIRTLTFRVLRVLLGPATFTKFLRSLQILEDKPLVRWLGSRYIKIGERI